MQKKRAVHYYHEEDASSSSPNAATAAAPSAAVAVQKETLTLHSAYEPTNGTHAVMTMISNGVQGHHAAASPHSSNGSNALVIMSNHNPNSSRGGSSLASSATQQNLHRPYALPDNNRRNNTTSGAPHHINGWQYQNGSANHHRSSAGGEAVYLHKSNHHKSSSSNGEGHCKSSNNTNNNSSSGDNSINSSGEAASNGGTAAEKKAPFFYCKTLGWDPTLNKFHIQLDTVDIGESRPSESNEPKSQSSSSPQSSSSSGSSAISAASKASMPSLVSSPQQEPERANGEGSSSGVTSDEGEEKVNNNNKDENAAEKPATTPSPPPPPPKQVVAPAATEESSPSIGVIQELGVNTTRKFAHQITKEEPVDVSSMPQLNSPPVCNKSVTPAKSPEEVETPGGGEKEEEESRLVIDLPPESKEKEGETDKAKEPTTTATATTTEQNKDKTIPKSPEEGEKSKEGGEKERSPSQEEEDFPCSQCSQVFTCNEDLQSHFSEAHVRLALNNIVEPESPFPTITVRGTSSIFEEEEVEESEPYPVTATTTAAATATVTAATSHPVVGNTLSTLLARRGSGESAERLMVEPIIAGYMHGQERGTAMQHPLSLVARPPPPSIPVSREPIFAQPSALDYRLRGAPAGAPQQLNTLGHPPSRMQQLPFRHAFPTALHQALVNQINAAAQQRAPPQQQQQQPAVTISPSQQQQRPQLRPIPPCPSATAVRPPTGVPNRPPLTRGPSPASQYPPHLQQQQQQQQQKQGPPQHSSHHSVVRSTTPPSQQAILRGHSPPNPQQPPPETEVLIRKMQTRLRQVQEQMQHLNHQLRNETNPHVLTRVQEDKRLLTEHYEQVLKQLSQIQNNQQQRQQLSQQIQMQHQHQQQMQIRHQQQQQQQLQQQQRNVVVTNPHPAAVSGQKRVSVEALEGSSLPKQARMEFERESDGSVRLPNGVTLSLAMPQSHHSSEALPSPPSSGGSGHVVAPGMHSGGSAGSRHSSGQASPAMVSPGTVGRLANSGITLTPASPQSRTPPVNPVLSPISDPGGSPRGSPRIPTNSVIQRVPPAAHSPHGSAVPEVNFAVPKAPGPPMNKQQLNNGASAAAVVTNPNAERPERPPTIDLTDDEVQAHNAHMRASAGGAVTQEQLNHHAAQLQRLRAAQAQAMVAQQKIQCPQCSVNCPNMERLAEHINATHRQPNPAHQQQFAPRGQQVAVRRSSPNSILAGRLEPPPMPRGALVPSRGPQPTSQLLQQMRAPINHPLSRTQEPPRAMEEAADKFVVPLLNLGGLDLPKLRALNDLGVVSFIPLQGITKLGIPIMRLRPDVSLGHFPHDTAIEVGPIRRLSSDGSTGPPSITNTNTNNSNNPRALPPPTSASSSITPPNRVAPITITQQPPPPPQQQQRALPAPPGAHYHHGTRPHHPQSPGEATLCTDRNCPDLRRSTAAIHHHPGHAPPPPAAHHHESFLGAHHPAAHNQHSQLIVTPVNRH